MAKRLRVFGAIMFLTLGVMAGVSAVMMGTTQFQAKEHTEDVEITLRPGEVFKAEFWWFQDPIVGARVDIWQKNESSWGNVSALAIPRSFVNAGVIEADTNLTQLQMNFTLFDLQVKPISGDERLVFAIDIAFPVDDLTIIIAGSDLEAGVPNSKTLEVAIFIGVFTQLTTDDFWFRWGFLEVSLLIAIAGSVMGLVLSTKKNND